MCDFTKICKKYDPEICDDVETLGEASVCLEEKQSPQAEQATASCLSELLSYFFLGVSYGNVNF